MTVGEAAQRWGVTERLVQRLCADGRIAGAVRFGRSWGIPASARKPRTRVANPLRSTMHSKQSANPVTTPT